jgi:hypothetical protein
MTVSVQVYEKGLLVTKLIPANQVEIEIDKKKVKVDDLINGFIKENKDLKDEIVGLKKYVDEINKNDIKWKVKTNEVLASILKTLKEQGEIY